MTKICPKCKSIAEDNAYYGRVTCTNCSWESDDSKYISYKGIVSSLGVSIPDEIMKLMNLQILDQVELILDKETKTITIKKSEIN